MMKLIIRKTQPVMTPVASGTLAPDDLLRSTPNRLALMNMSLNFGTIL